MATKEQAAAQVESNDPEVKPRQTWRLLHEYEVFGYPAEVRVCGAYPFASEEEGRCWIVEARSRLEHFMRVAELSLRMTYELVEDPTS
jgi:hypothetical protein